jgi:hypothetical protein
MAPVTKSTHHLSPTRNERGQISIFFSASLIVLVSIVAFVINVGLFVKAKINLQNATDAAAFSGAAVQARQLSKIAYLNWEMRNIFKEWMYKYYVIGNLNVSGTVNPPAGIMRFNLDDDENVITNVNTSDPFNIPAVCIHIAGSQTNICKRFAVPGLPEFGGYNLPGSEEASRAFIDALIGGKVNDCVERSKLNSYVATMWAYNVMALDSNDSANSMAGRGPAILADRQGAWPRAIELAMRIRNLEKAFNRPAIVDGVCNRQSNTGQTKCQNTINIYEQQNQLGNERIVKAFYSGFRNLGNQTDNEMKETFTLTELPPRKKEIGTEWDNSNLLIPANSLYEKQWLDLKLMMVNFATFYAALIPRADSATSGACDISKIAIPVPGYPMGFYKNPDVVTYYAVRGEAEFVGMFNPFNADSIKLTAFSAAKPFGGRIGPMLFTQKKGETFIRGRTDNLKFRSVPYLLTLSVQGTPLRNPRTGAMQPLGPSDFLPGAPLPINFQGQEFWLTQADGPVGGKNNNEVSFGIPNMVYDFLGGMSPDSYTPSGARLATVNSAPGGSAPKAGLYSSDQFSAFKGSLGGVVTPARMDEEIARVRSATRYEAANYLIPTPMDFNMRNNVDSFGFISGPGQPMGSSGITKYVTHVYAPLFRANNNQTDLLWNSVAEVKSTIYDFMRQQEAGIMGYIYSLNKAAKTIYDMQGSGAASGAIASYQKAAESISDFNLASGNPNTSVPRSCKSLAGQFLHFYYGEPELPDLVVDKTTEPCPTTLGSMLSNYFSQAANDPNYQPTHYVMNYYIKSNQDLSIYSAYTPGPYSGVGPTGLMTPPFPGLQSEMMRRNFYSTKFVTLDSLQNNGGYNEQGVTNFVIYSEGDLATSPGFDRSQNLFENYLEAQQAGADLSSIKY